MWKKLNDRGKEERTLELLLRIGVAGCYIGHGAFGVMGKQAWLPYFAVAGIGPDLAWTLMPIVGSIDILVGIVALMSPRPVVLVYGAVWAVWTALLRPLSGESLFETLERAGNYGIPIAFLILAAVSARPTIAWLKEIEIPELGPERRRAVRLALRASVATLLVGHGGLAFLGKPLLASHAAAIGLPEGSLAFVGAFEIALAAAVVVKPVPGLLLGILGWKLATEALFPFTGAPFWEFVERAGSYVAPLALWYMDREPASAKLSARARTAVVVLLSGGVAAGVGATLGFASERDAGGLHAGLGPDVGLRWASEAGPGAQEASLLASLRSGGYVLACRHAITDRSRGDARRVDFDDPSTQRVLNDAGRDQARRLGEVIRRQQIPIGEVLTSPYARTVESAELAFGPAEVSSALYGGGADKRRRLDALLEREPDPGTNRVLMTHQGILYRALPDVERGSIREGDCMVIDPDGRGFEVVTRLGPDELEALTVREPLPASESNGAVTAARRGGTVIVCRHAITNSFREREPVDYADSTTQRLLSRRGERQSRRIGEAMSALGIEVAELIASPMSRARRTAELMFAREPVIDSTWHTNGGSYSGSARDARRRTLARPVDGGNRLIVSHIGTMESVLDGIRGRVGEGDCVVVQPGGDGYEVVGVVEDDAWRTPGPDRS